MHQADVTLRHGHRDAGTHQRRAARRQLGVLGGDQVGAGVTGVGVRRQRQVGVEPADTDVGTTSVTATVLTQSRSARAAPTLPSCRARPRRRAVPFQRDTASPRDRSPDRHPPLRRAAGRAVVDVAGGAGGRPRCWPSRSGWAAPACAAWVPFAVLVPAVAPPLPGRAGRIRVAVTGGEFQVDDARLPVAVISDVVALDAAGKREALGVGAHPLAFVVQRPWIGRRGAGVLDDPADPTPFWVVSTRHPVELATALLARPGPATTASS